MTTWRTHHLRARRRRLIHLGIIGAARFTPKMPWLQMSPLKSVEAMAALGRAMDELARAMVESLGVPPWLLSAGPGYLNTGFAAGGMLSAHILSDEQLRIAMLAPPAPMFFPREATMTWDRKEFHYPDECFHKWDEYSTYALCWKCGSRRPR